MLQSRNLHIENEETSKEILLNNNYYYLINGYKDLFLNRKSKSEKFRNGTTLEEIYNLYEFDRKIRIIFLEYILLIERKIDTYIAYEFSKNYGHKDYLIPENFNNINKNKKLNDEVIQDNYSNKYNELGNSADIDLLKKLKEEGMLISMVNTHKSNDISSICYAILEELSKTDNYPIKKCQNCGMYFIPNSRLDEIYCDYPKENGKTCREQGAILSYNKRLQEKSAYTEYRKTYQQKFGIINKNKDDKNLKKEFETWKKQAKEKITKLKHGELTEDEVYKWLQKNK